MAAAALQLVSVVVLYLEKGARKNLNKAIGWKEELTECISSASPPLQLVWVAQGSQESKLTLKSGISHPQTPL